MKSTRLECSLCERNGFSKRGFNIVGLRMHLSGDHGLCGAEWKVRRDEIIQEALKGSV